MKDIQKIEIESTESIEYFFFSGVSFTFDYGKGNAQFRQLSLPFSSIRVKLLYDFRHKNL